MADDTAETVEPASDWTVVLSGPLAQKTVVLAALDQAGGDLTEPQQPDAHWATVYGDTPDATVGWVTCRVQDVNNDAVSGAVGRAGWRLRAHWHTPTCGVCSGLGAANGDPCAHCGGRGVTNRPAPTVEQLLRADLEEMRVELAALKARP